MGENKNPTRLATFTLCVFLLASIFLFREASQSHFVEINTDGQPTLGSATAKVHLVVFEDVRCCNCQSFGSKILPKIKEKYVKTGKAKITHISLAFMKGSSLASNAALCIHHINPKIFFPFLEKLHKIPLADESKWASMAYLIKIAMEVGGIDPYLLQSCMRQKVCYVELDKNLQLARKTMGKSFGTPTLYINGIFTPSHSFEEIEKTIEKYLKKTK